MRSFFLNLINKPLTIKEDLIHYIWKTKNFDQSDLKTTNGQSLHVIHFGHHNDDAGPDFLHAKIEIDGTIWAGHVEIHIKASDWIKHRHDEDKGYQNVILHVVMFADVPIILQDKTTIPCLELKRRVSHLLIGRYQYLQNNQFWIPCEELIASVPDITKENTKNRALAERLTENALVLKEQLTLLNQDINELIYRRLAWAFGLKVNADPMLHLASSIPYKVLQKHKDQISQIEALLFGQSGLVDKDKDHEYVNALLKEYKILQVKYQLKPMEAVHWKYSRLRPPAFPTLRIAQFARFIYDIPRLDQLIYASDIQLIKDAFEINLSGYWEHHYRFGVPSIRRNKALGKASISIIIINAIVPILFMYGMIRQNQGFKNKAIEMLEDINPELNRITKRWDSLGMINKNAADSQALLQLKKFNCDQYQCLHCPIGHKIIATKI